MLYSHNIVGLQSCVWRGVDEYIGKGVLVMIVHLICKGHSLGITAAPPSPALWGPKAPGELVVPPFWSRTDSDPRPQLLPALCRALAPARP